MKNGYFDKEGKPIDLMTWGKQFGNWVDTVVKQEVVGKYWISTVWLGLDHSFIFTGEGPIAIFETMVFPKNKDMSKIYEQERHSTNSEEAKAFHQEMVEKYKKKEDINGY